MLGLTVMLTQLALLPQKHDLPNQRWTVELEDLQGTKRAAWNPHESFLSVSRSVRKLLSSHVETLAATNSVESQSRLVKAKNDRANGNVDQIHET